MSSVPVDPGAPGVLTTRHQGQPAREVDHELEVRPSRGGDPRDHRSPNLDGLADTQCLQLADWPWNLDQLVGIVVERDLHGIRLPDVGGRDVHQKNHGLGRRVAGCRVYARGLPSDPEAIDLPDRVHIGEVRQEQVDSGGLCYGAHRLTLAGVLIPQTSREVEDLNVVLKIEPDPVSTV